MFHSYFVSLVLHPIEWMGIEQIANILFHHLRQTIFVSNENKTKHKHIEIRGNYAKEKYQMNDEVGED